MERGLRTTGNAKTITPTPNQNNQSKPSDNNQPLLDYGRRNYDTSNGIFTSIDPVINGYAYNPLSNNSTLEKRLKQGSKALKVIDDV